MCLYSKTGTPEIAGKDISCYKVIAKSKFIEFDKNGDGTIPLWPNPIKKFFKKFRKYRYYTPYQEKQVLKSIINGKENLIAVGEENIEEPYYEWDNNYSISEGFIHTYGSLAEMMKAFHNENIFKSTDDYTYELYQCIIPKGTKYFSGKDDNGHYGYASKEIKFVEKLAEMLI